MLTSFTACFVNYTHTIKAGNLFDELFISLIDKCLARPLTFRGVIVGIMFIVRFDN